MIGLIGAGLTTIVILGAAFGSFYTVDQGEIAIELTNGKVTDIAGPGFQTKMPIVDSVVLLSGREEPIQVPMTAYSADRQTADLILTVITKIDAANAAEIYERGGTFYLDKLVKPKVDARAKVVFGRFTAARAITERGELNAQMAEAIRQSVEPTQVQVLSVEVNDVTFSAAYNQAVEDRMQAEVEVAKLEQTEKQEQVKARVKVTQAKADADSAIARATAEAERTQLQAVADAERIRLKGEADAAAIRATGQARADAIAARSEALKDNPQLVGLIAAERWNGKLPSTMVPNATLPFLSVQRTEETGTARTTAGARQ